MINKLILNSILITITIIKSTESVISSAERTNSHQTYNQALYPVLTQPPVPNHCYRESRCRPLNNSQCLDVTLPYKFTTTNVFVENAPFAQIHDYLSRWKGLRSIPQCWKALQSVLCATFFPRCDNESSRVSLPTHEMCRFTRHPCRLIEQHYQWPEFLRCDNDTLYPNKCKNEYTDLKFNQNSTAATGARCAAPLVSTDDQNIWYPGIEGCALHCLNPLYTIEAHKKMWSFISHGAGISLIATLFSVLTFIIDWRSSNRYPAVIIFYLNMCFMIADTGWLWQSVLTKARSEIVCRPDNTSRYGEPGNSPENFYCLSVFLLIYYFSMAALVWFVNLAYAWDLSFQTSSTSHRDSVNSKVAYFHLTAWSVPLMLSITILALGEVDGDSLRGICYVGVLKPVMRICFVLVPTTVSLIIGCYYMFRAMLKLIKVKLINKSQNNLNRNKSKKIEHMIIRIGFFVMFAITATVITYVSHIYEFTHSSHWKKSLNDYIICTLNMTAALYPDTTSEPSESVHSCKLVDRPNLMYAYLELVAIFGAGIVTSSWVWTTNSLSGWKRFIVRHLKPDLNEPIRLKRHEMISKVFGRRHQLTQGCYSPSFHSMHSDPVGMNLNSAVSQDLSATWAAALPNFMYRRGAIVGTNGVNDPTLSNQTTHYLPTFVGNRHSSNSDVSQQRSYDSFRRSLDSQISLEQLEMVAIDRHQRRKTRKEREKLLKAHKSSRSNPYHFGRRRGSDTSGSIISAALGLRGLQKVAKSECKSTSTRDLDLLSLAPSQQMPPQIIANPFMTPPIASPSSLALHPYSQLGFSAPNIIPRARPPKPDVTSFTFTHGMSDQSSHLTNPLLEKRRPDSCVPQHHNNAGHVLHVPNTSPNGSQLNPNTNNLQFTAPTANPMSNYGISYMNGMNALNNGLNFIGGAQSLNYFPPLNTYYGNLLANSQANSYPNFMAPGYPTTPLPGMQFQPQYPPYPQYPLQAQAQPQPPVQHCANLQEIQALMRQREAYLQLFQPMDSASEQDDNFLPIQLSDSEGIYSPEALSRNEDLITNQQLVDERMQRVEANAAINGQSAVEPSKHNQSIVGALGDGLVRNVLEMGSQKQSQNSSKISQKSETKRKKKKSSKKHKMNGTIANNNNNINGNDVNIDSEEQKPLMTCELSAKTNDN